MQQLPYVLVAVLMSLVIAVLLTDHDEEAPMPRPHIATIERVPSAPAMPVTQQPSVATARDVTDERQAARIDPAPAVHVTSVPPMVVIPTQLEALTEDALIALRQWAELEPDHAATAVEEASSGEVRVRLLDEVLGIWASNAPLDALAWIAARKGQVSANVPTVIDAYAESSPASAADWLGEHPDEGSLDNWRIVVDRWGAQDPLSMLDAMERRLGPGLREALLPDVLASLDNPALAQDYLKAFPAEVNDAALAMAHRSRAHDPAIAQALLEMIGDGTVREGLVREQSRHEARPGDAGLLEAEIGPDVAEEPLVAPRR